MIILFVIVVFSLLGAWLIYVQHRACEVNCAIADFCYTIGTGKDPDEDE